MSRSASRTRELRVGEQVDLRVSAAGEFILPREVVERLGLAPGDLIALEAGCHSVHLGLYQELLDAVAGCLDEHSAWFFAEEFLSQPLTAVLAGGRLPIPREVVTLAVGERWVLQIVRRGLSHELFLFRVSVDG